MMRFFFTLLGSIGLSLVLSAQVNTELALLPSVETYTLQKEKSIDLQRGLRVQLNNPIFAPLRKIIAADYFKFLGKENPATANAIELELKLDRSFSKEKYTLNVGEEIILTGGSYAAVVMGLTTLWQALDEEGKLLNLSLSDQPQYGYRSIMLDLARAWHDPATIRTIIDLCRWYKINYLHLHLTDDSAFTFPSTHYPQLATEGHAYTKTQLLELNEYAYERGVILVPELDVPGHASQLVKKEPQVFGIAQTKNNPYTISMAKDTCYAALGILLQEIAEVFSYTPYLHIGGDEAFFEGMQDDPETLAYLAKHQLADLHELFRHFLIRIHKLVKQTGKQTIVWAGFSEHGKLEIPRDMIVMLWEQIYYDPKALLADGFPIINASFKPLYVVNNRKWGADYIYREWTPNRWESWANTSDTFLGTAIPSNQQVMGATMCAWEQHQINQLPRLRHRVASMSERLWSQKELPWEVFHQIQQRNDAKLDRLLHGFTISLQGLNDPSSGEGNFYEHLWFDELLELKLQPLLEGLHFKYAMSSQPALGPWQDWKEPLQIKETCHLRIQAFNAYGRAVGHPYYQRFFLKPVKVKPHGLLKELPIGSWEKQRFIDSLGLVMTTANPKHTIRYTLDGTRVTDTAAIYTQPIAIRKTSRVQAQAYDEQGQKVGTSFADSYYQLWPVQSLTTGKRIWSSREKTSPGLATLANNGRITIWEQWGDHKSEENWIQVDLGEVASVTDFQLVCFWDNYRYYQYTIEASLDGENWTELVDARKNTKMADAQGYWHQIEATSARFLKVNMLFNSANPGLHIVEFCAWDKRKSKTK